MGKGRLLFMFGHQSVQQTAALSALFECQLADVVWVARWISEVSVFHKADSSYRTAVGPISPFKQQRNSLMGKKGWMAYFLNIYINNLTERWQLSPLLFLHVVQTICIYGRTLFSVDKNKNKSIISTNKRCNIACNGWGTRLIHESPLYFGFIRSFAVKKLFMLV